MILLIFCDLINNIYKKMDKALVIIIVVVILAGAGFWAWQSGFFTNNLPAPVEPVPIPEGIILFYGDGCPHCKDVEDFISQNKIEDKVKITRMEVWYNKSNAALLGQVAQKCGITSDSVGIPFLYDPPSGEAGGNGKCYIGEIDVPNFLKNAAGIQ